jgi:primase-polymerase (primpol)-like protein
MFNSIEYSQSSYLLPRLDDLPFELRCKNNWVVWKGKKIPFDASCVNSKASVSNPQSWSSFGEAKTAFEEGGWDGLGFMLDGTGIAGVDLDKCVVNGIPDTKAIEILTDLNAQYVELSPSGGGLRAFGYADCLPKGRNGVLHGVSTELYTKDRYLTVTGHAIKCGEFKPFENFSKLANLLRKQSPPTEVTEVTEVTEDTECNPSVSSVSSVCTDNLVIPSSLIPTSYGQRNKKLFELAMHPTASSWQLGSDGIWIRNGAVSSELGFFDFQDQVMLRTLTARTGGN